MGFFDRFNMGADQISPQTMGAMTGGQQQTMDPMKARADSAQRLLQVLGIKKPGKLENIMSGIGQAGMSLAEASEMARGRPEFANVYQKMGARPTPQDQYQKQFLSAYQMLGKQKDQGPQMLQEYLAAQQYPGMMPAFTSKYSKVGRPNAVSEIMALAHAWPKIQAAMKKSTSGTGNQNTINNNQDLVNKSIEDDGPLIF